MRITPPSREKGIALVIVMIVIIVLAVLAGGLAYSMKVETRLARNSSFDSDVENLARSAVERGRYILAQHLRIPGEGAYSSLNQFWASGLPSTNELLMDLYLENDELPRGHTIIEITDMERKFNLSVIRDERYSPILQKALETMGIDPMQVTDIVDSYLDWVDPDDN
jgi:type II secretory pathway component PulK